MESLLECVMTGSYYLALIGLPLYYRKQIRDLNQTVFFTVATMGIGFLAGAVSKALSVPADWSIFLYLGGIILAMFDLLYLYALKLGIFKEKKQTHLRRGTITAERTVNAHE